jgi:hypothetical protein
MANALSLHHPGMRSLAEKSKTDLLKHVMSIKNGLTKHKEKAKHGFTTLAHAALASAGGGTAGVLAVKMPHIPKTKIRTDLAIGGLVGLAAAAGVLDEASALAGAFAQGLLGYGVGDATKTALLAHGWKQAA